MLWRVQVTYRRVSQPPLTRAYAVVADDSATAEAMVLSHEPWLDTYSIIGFKTDAHQALILRVK